MGAWSNRRNLPRLSAAVVLGLAVLVGAPRARAQPAPPATVPSVPAAAPTANDLEGRAAFDRGMTSLQARQFSDAVTSLREALRLRPTALTVYNLALALRGRGSYVETVDLFDRYLVAPEPGALPDRLAAIRDEVAVLRRSIARVELNLEPASAELRIDGRSVRRDQTALRLDPGAHVVDVLSEGFVPDRREITLAPGGQMVLAISLRRVSASGRLLVEPSVATAVIAVDGRRAGVGRIDEPLGEGAHLVEITAPGYQPFRRQVRLGASGVTRLDAALVGDARGLPGWVLPTAIVGGAALLAGSIALGVALSSSSAAPPPPGNLWDQVNAP